MPRPSLRPVVWDPPAAPERARAKASSPPMPSPTLCPLPAVGPEDVVLDADGLIITGTEDGRILRVDPTGGAVSEVARTGGRPLGIERAGDALVVCDAYEGLLRVDAGTGGVERLCTAADGVPLNLCNNAAVASDGTIYFTDSTQRFPLEHWRGDLAEHGGTGRLLRRRPDGATDVILDGLQFANGVALAPDESFVAVAETGSYRIQRVWLAGDRAGAAEVLTDNLPGFPDNISTGSDGLIWIALGSPRNAVLDWLHPRRPVLRKALWALPEQLLPKPVETAWVLALDAGGTVVHDFQRSDPSFHLVTGVREQDGRVYMGSIVAAAVAWFDLP